MFLLPKVVKTAKEIQRQKRATKPMLKQKHLELDQTTKQQNNKNDTAMKQQTEQNLLKSVYICNIIGFKTII